MARAQGEGAYYREAVEALLARQDIVVSGEHEDQERIPIQAATAAFALQAIARVRGSRRTDGTPYEQYQALSDAQRATLLDQSGTELRTWGRSVAMADNIQRGEATVLVEGADEVSTPRAQFQAEMLQVLRRHSQTTPRESVDRSQDGLLVVAPTGSGKTTIQARHLAQLGIGRAASAHDSDPLRALLIVPSQKLVHQYTGKTGDDTFRRFLGSDVRVTSYWEKKKDTSGHVVVTTKKSLPDAIARGEIQPEQFDVAVMDEGHHGLALKMRQCLGELGLQLFFYTATPAYSPDRDLRTMVSHVEAGSLRGFVEKGILSPVRLLTFVAERGTEEAMAAKLAQHYVAAGNKVVVYCQGGQDSRQARDIAATVNGLSGATVAGAVGRFNRYGVEDTLAQYEEGELSMLATVRMLREGWNAPVDVIINVGPSFSGLDLEQKIGRAMRPGEREAIVIEVVPKASAGRREMASIWKVFGLDYIIEDYRLGPTPLLAEGDRENDDMPQKAMPPSATQAVLPELLQSLVINRPVSSIMLAPETRARAESAPEGYAAISALAERHQLPQKWLQYKLDGKGFIYVGVWGSGGERGFERWYEPAAAEYLESKSFARLAGEGEMNTQAIAKMCSVSDEYIKTLIERLSIEPLRRLNKVHRTIAYYDMVAVTAIIKELEATPLAAESDVAIMDLTEELGYDFVSIQKFCGRPEHAITMVHKRRCPLYGILGFALHITAEEAERVRAFYGNVQVATDHHISYVEVAELAGVAKKTLLDKLTDEEKAATVQLRKSERTRGLPGAYLPMEMGLAVAERLEPDKLPPHLVTLSMMAKRVTVDKRSITYWLRDTYTRTTLGLGGQGGEVSCYPWQALQALEEAYPVRPDVAAIDYAMIVTGPGDTSLERWRYTQQLQALYTPNEKLLPPPTPPRPKEEEKPAPPLSDRLKDLPPEQRQRAALVMASRGESPKAAPEKKAPNGYVDLAAYLEQNKTPCRHNLLKMLLRQVKGPAAIIWRDTANNPWVPEPHAKRIMDLISTYKPAPDGSKTPYEIASTSGVDVDEVIRLASNVLDSTAGYINAYRTINPDGSLGMLDVFYRQSLVQEIERQLAQRAERSRKRMRNRA